MKASTIAVHWHDDNHPIYSLDFQPNAKNSRQVSKRLATAGGDNNVRIWRVQYPKNDEEISIEYLSTLRKHTQAVNVVRFDPMGQMLATGGDDGLLVIWVLADKIISEFGHQDDDVQESWVARYVYNTNSEIYDLAWAPDSSHIVTGSMDNTAKIYSVQAGQLCELANHSHYVQGVSWDPLNEYLATQSADRSVSVYNLGFDSSPSPALLYKASRAELPVGKLSKSSESSCGVVVELDKPKKSTALYHSETLQSFFRRLAFSPDGSMLLTPSGVFKNHEEKGKIEKDAEKDEKSDLSDDTPMSLNTVYIYIRSGLSRAPVCHLPGLAKPAIAIAFNPNTYKLSGEKPVFLLPYKMVFAVATQDSVIIYDTEHLSPLGVVSNLHYLTITDLCWERDGSSILVSSAEGFCSAIMFEPETFGPLADATEETPKKGAEMILKAEATEKTPKRDATNRDIGSGSTSAAPTDMKSAISYSISNLKIADPIPTVKKSDPIPTVKSADQIPTVKSADPISTVKSTDPQIIEELQVSSQEPVAEVDIGEKSSENIQIQPNAGVSTEPVSSDNRMVTQSMLDQFMAKTFVAPASPVPQSPQAEEASKRSAEHSEHEPKKKRITPTVVEKRE